MHTDVVYETLHPFHLWAWIAAVCAFTLAAAACAVLVLSQRPTRRWWLGMSIFAACLLTVAFGTRSRATAYDLRGIVASCYKPPISTGCEIWAPQVVAAQQHVEVLGIAVLIATLLSLAATAFVLFRHRPPDSKLRLHASVIPVAATIFIAGCGVYWTADGIAHWIEFADEANNPSGDGLSILNLEFAIATTIFGALVLAAGLGGVIASSKSRRASVIANPQSQL